MGPRDACLPIIMKRNNGSSAGGPLSEPPLDFPKQINKPESKTCASNVATPDTLESLVQQQKYFDLRFGNHDMRLRTPIVSNRVIGYKENQSIGCITLPEGMRRPWPTYHFPEELYDVLTPSTDSKGKLTASTGTRNFIPKETTINFDKLQQEEKGRSKKERKPSIVSEHSDLEDDDDDEDQGEDYNAQAYYESDVDDIEGDDDATF